MGIIIFLLIFFILAVNYSAPVKEFVLGGRELGSLPPYGSKSGGALPPDGDDDCAKEGEKCIFDKICCKTTADGTKTLNCIGGISNPATCFACAIEGEVCSRPDNTFKNYCCGSLTCTREGIGGCILNDNDFCGNAKDAATCATSPGCFWKDYTFCVTKCKKHDNPTDCSAETNPPNCIWSTAGKFCKK